MIVAVDFGASLFSGPTASSEVQIAIERAVACGTSRITCATEADAAKLRLDMQSMHVEGLRVGCVGRVVTLAYSDPIAD